MPDLTRNLLLQQLGPDSLERLRPHFAVGTYETGHVLYEPGDPMTSVYFPLDGVVSVTTPVSGSDGEVATIGLEGLVGLPLLLATNVAQMRAFMQIGGTLAVLSADELLSAAEDDVSLHRTCLRYAQALFTQVGQSVVCNQRHTLRQRCARWLLTTHDRVDGDSFHLTHEFLAMMLGVRRAGVTVAAGALQRAGLIQYRRGTVRILDREGLERVSCECYERIRHAYERILGTEPEVASAR